VYAYIGEQIVVEIV